MHAFDRPTAAFLFFLLAIVLTPCARGADEADKVLILLPRTCKEYAEPIAAAVKKDAEDGRGWMVLGMSKEKKEPFPVAVSVQVVEALKDAKGWRYAVYFSAPRSLDATKKRFSSRFTLYYQESAEKAPVEVFKDDLTFRLGGKASTVAEAFPQAVASTNYWGDEVERQLASRVFVGKGVADLPRTFWPVTQGKEKGEPTGTVKLHNRLPVPVRLTLDLRCQPNDVNLSQQKLGSLPDQVFVLRPGVKRDVTFKQPDKDHPFTWAKSASCVIVDDTLAPFKK